jgi:hypothetical protein
VPRLSTLLITAALVVPASCAATATAAPSPGDAVQSAGVADDAAEAPDGPVFTPAELTELCSATPGRVDPGPVADETDPAFADVDASDPDDPVGGDPSDGPPLCGSVSRAQLLGTGVLNTGTVSLAGAGTVTQELWLPGRVTGSTARAHLRATRTGGGLLAGSVTRTVSKARAVHLSVRLNRTARARLRRAQHDVRITVRTVTRVRGGAARTHLATIVVRRGAA